MNKININFNFFEPIAVSEPQLRQAALSDFLQKMGTIQEKEKELKKKVHLYKEHIEHTSSTDYPNVYSFTEQENFSLEKFKTVSNSAGEGFEE